MRLRLAGSIVLPRLRRGGLGLAVLVLSAGTGAVRPAALVPVPAVSMGPDGRLLYTADDRGNRIIDFSQAGYDGGAPIPDVAERARVSSDGGRHQERVQAAIDRISELPIDASGFRGAVVLSAGTFEIAGTIRIRASGVVLRGSGAGDSGTILAATGLSRRALIEVGGDGAPVEVAGSRQSIAAPYVHTGATAIAVGDPRRFSVGDRVLVHRPSTARWIETLGMNRFQGWRPENRLHWQSGSRDVTWDRVVIAVDEGRLSIDAPLTASIDREMGGGWVARYEFPGRIAHAGVERLRLVSRADPARPADEDHAWIGITLNNIENAWVRQVAASHFAGSAVDVQRHTRAVTVEDVDAVDPVSEVGGYRRRAFYTEGQLGLFQRLKSRGAQHDFATGFLAAGPNVFFDSIGEGSLDFSGALESWSSGTLFDNVRIRGNALRLGDRDAANQGAGWAAANSVLWNCEATEIEADSPPGAFNRAYGSRGILRGNGAVEDARAVPFRDFFRGLRVEPPSLYRAQRVESGFSRTAEVRLKADTTGRTTEVRLKADTTSRDATTLRVENGRFMIGVRPAWTKRTNYSWFQAQMAPALAPSLGPAITRFAPGRTGPGLTDDLEQVVRGMPPGGVFYQHYGLWYDRRRVNHNYDGSAGRADGNVWAPFMELPWARSGTGKAWDGLSRFDLTRFNPWYFARLREFADLCDREGRVLYYNFYFQHWLLESRAHYVDFPWRPVNAIQDTGMPDEVPAANDFWDLSHPLRRDLHQRYIRHVLDTLGQNTNVVFGIDREYTGSLTFLRFWLDEIASWQKKAGSPRVFVALEVPKDQLDAILADPIRAPLVAAIDSHGWVYRPDGRLFAIKGGLNRSPREQRPDIATPEEREALRARLDPAMAANPDYQNGPEFQKLFDQLWASTPALRERARREYRERYPNLVILSEEPAK